MGISQNNPEMIDENAVSWCITVFFFQDSAFLSFFGVAISFIPISIIIRMPLCGDIHVLLSPVDSDIDIRKTHCFPLGT